MRGSYDAFDYVVLPPDDIAAEGEGTLAYGHHAQLSLKLVRLPLVIAVTKGDVSSASAANGMIACKSGTAIFCQILHFDTLIESLVSMEDSKSLLACRVVIGDEQFQMVIALTKDGADTGLHERGAIVRRHNDGHEFPRQMTLQGASLLEKVAMLSRNTLRCIGDWGMHEANGSARTPGASG